MEMGHIDHHGIKQKSKNKKFKPEEEQARLAATGLYLTLCVENITSSLKPLTRGKRLKGRDIPAFWKIDIPRLIEVLAEHGLVDPREAYNDKTFYTVRNSYIALRRLKLRSVEMLVTTMIKSRKMIEEFCRQFKEEAGHLIII